MSKSEGVLQTQVIKWLNANRILHWRIHLSSLANFPDILALHKGTFYGIELKRDEKTKARLGQLQLLRHINENGGVGVVISSIEELEELFKEE